MKTYKDLIAGDVRQKGDETKRTVRCHQGYDTHPNDMRPDWRPVLLIGHKLIPSDFMIANFRRPVEVAVD